MINNYFKIAWRNLLRNKWFSFINILGLSIGIGTCLIIMLFVSNELSYDRFNKKADRIARVYFQGEIQGEKMKESSVMAPVAGAMIKEFPEVEDATRLKDMGFPKMLYNNQVFRDDAVGFADANFFRVFTLPFIKGDMKTALTEPNTVVVTRDVAKKYFGNDEAIGKTISFKDGDNKAPMRVTGVIENIPQNSHLRFGLLASMAGLEESKQQNWMSSNFHTYIELKDAHDFNKLEAKIPTMVDKYIGPQMKDGTGLTLAEFRKGGSNLTFHLQKLTDIHFYSDFQGDLNKPGNIRNVYIFSAVAIFMLLIACINFMNLSTAGASKRSREVGIRKVLGSMKWELVRQFLAESILIAFIALLLSLVFIKLALPVFNDLSGQQLTLSFVDHTLMIPALIGVILVTGLIAGSYPAFYLSSFKPVAVLKGKFISGKSGVSFRSALVVFQFFISIILIVSTMVVYNQLSFIQTKEVGYNKDKVLVISGVWALGKNMDIFRKQLQEDPAVSSVSASGYLPAGPGNNNNFFVSSVQEPEKMVKTLKYEVDEKYIQTLGIKIKEGRNFSLEYGRDSAAVILNEAAAHALGWKQGATGQTISRVSKRGEKEFYNVIGVVKDFNFRSLHERISPLVMVLAPDPGNLVAKVNTANTKGLIEKLQKRFKEYGTEDPMSYSFLDERFSNTYKSEEKAGTILAIFAGLTIFVACLGLFGLAKFTAEQRTKEIGIRKVLGATPARLSAMLSKEFVKLVLIACLIAFPAAWWAMNKWLQDFAYRVNVGWIVFVIAAVAALSIALITVSWQAIKAALANPVKSLRTE